MVLLFDVVDLCIVVGLLELDSCRVVVLSNQLDLRADNPLVLVVLIMLSGSDIVLLDIGGLLLRQLL